MSYSQTVHSISNLVTGVSNPMEICRACDAGLPHCYAGKHIGREEEIRFTPDEVSDL